MRKTILLLFSNDTFSSARNSFVLSESYNRKGKSINVKSVNIRPESLLIFGEKYHSKNCLFDSAE